MRELSLNVLDIAQNSITAKANLIEIDLTIYPKNNFFYIIIKDNGCGMDSEMIKRVCDPFTTTRTTRKVGMGIPLFKMSAEMSGGTFEITSQKGVGTTVKAGFQIDNVDRMPLGDFEGTIITLVAMNTQIDFLVKITNDLREGVFDTREFKKILDGVPIDSPEILAYIKEYFSENLTSIIGGIL